jgi:hypothetical protein
MCFQGVGWSGMDVLLRKGCKNAVRLANPKQARRCRKARSLDAGNGEKSHRGWPGDQRAKST